MLAHWLQIFVLSFLASSLALTAAVWHLEAWVAPSAFAAVMLFFSGVLLVQFLLLLPLANRKDQVVQATWTQLVRAWLAETVAALLVFYWWQPFRARAVPDQIPAAVNSRQSRGVVFVHGFICNRALWTPWLRVMQRRGIAFIAVNLEPVFGSIDAYAEIVDAAVRQMTAATGKSPLLVCHSMGGLAARAWMRECGAEGRVHHVVTLGSPHHGTQLAAFAPHPRWLVNGDQMRFGSQWLAKLERDEPPANARKFTCFYSNCDNIVLSASSATLDGADNRLVAGVGHLEMVLDQQVMDQTLAML